METKEEFVKRLLLELPKLSGSRLARIVQCDPKLVSSVRKELLAKGEIRRCEAPDDEEDI